MSIYESNKRLFEEALTRYAEALDSDRVDRAANLRIAIEGAYNGAMDVQEAMFKRRVEQASLEPPKLTFEIMPLAMQAGDRRVLVNGSPLEAPFRIINEELFQKMKKVYDAAK